MDIDVATIWIVALIAAAALTFRYGPRWRARSPFVTPEALKTRLDAGDDVVVLDVRTEAEFAGPGGHVPGAINLPLGDLQAQLLVHGGDPALPRDRPIYVHCAGSMRASTAARALREARYTEVAVVDGGLRAWRRRGFPLAGATR
ncbi:MAG: rhodanese-like domain-containing protein [Rhodospirillales bacterium]